MQIGTIDYNLEAGDCFLWQYANAIRLNQIMNNEISFYGNNISTFIKDWEKDVFNLGTANTFGLNVWGKILGAPRPVVSPQNYIIDSESTLRIFNPNTDTWHAIWLSDATPRLNIERNPPTDLIYSKVLLSDEQYRRCLFAKLFLLHSNGSVNDINIFLSKLFPNKDVYVQDNYDMTMSIVFGFVPNDTDLTIITYDAFSPRPMGVFMNYGVSLVGKNTFGFEENELGTWGDNDNSLDADQIALGLGTFYNL